MDIFNELARVKKGAGSEIVEGECFLSFANSLHLLLMRCFESLQRIVERSNVVFIKTLTIIIAQIVFGCTI